VGAFFPLLYTVSLPIARSEEKIDGPFDLNLQCLEMKDALRERITGKRSNLGKYAAGFD